MSNQEPGTRNQEPITSEQEVILSAVRADRSQDGRIRELLLRGLDWPLLCRTALRHGVLPLLYVRLAEIGGDLAPGEEMARLRDLYLSNSRRNLLMAAELLKLLRLFNSSGIAAIPFKGPVLAVQAYGDLGLRQFADLDILVRREDMEKVEEMLPLHGYRPRYAFTPAQKRAHFRRTCECTFSARGDTLHLDVHWRLAADYLTAGLDPAAEFAGQGTVVIEGHRVPALEADDMLLYLCLHGVLHLWTKLGAICDIDRLIRANPERDWNGLLEKAEAAGLRRTLLLGLSLARDLLATDLPPAIAEAAAKDRDVAPLRERVTARLFGRGDSEPGFAEIARFQLPLKDRFSDRIKYCLIRAFCPTVEDWQCLPLPDRLYFLYFLVRPLRLSGMLRRSS